MSKNKHKKQKRKEASKMVENDVYTQSLVRGTGWKVKRQQEEEVECSLVFKPTTYIEPIPRYKIEMLMDEYPNQEWLGYLVGKVSERKNIFIEDLVIPPHAEVSAASAEAEPFNIPENCVGIIHSHHHMGAFRSVTDMDYVDKNFLISIIVSKNTTGLVYDTVSCQKTPCGKIITGKSSIKYVRPEPPFESKSFLDKAKLDIDKGKTILSITTDWWDKGDYDFTINKVNGGKVVSRPLYRPAIDVHSAQKTLYVNRSGAVMTQTEADKLDREEI